MSDEIPEAPEWVFEKRSQPNKKPIEGVKKEQLFVLSGAISSEWSQIERGVDELVYAMLGAYDLDRPNSKPVADAILSSHRTFDGKVKLLRKLASVVLVRQPNLHNAILFALNRAEAVADHRNAVIHGAVTNVSFQETAPFCLFLVEADGANSFKPFPKKGGQPIDFNRSSKRFYSRDDLGGLLAAIGEVYSELFQLLSDPYIRALADGELLPSQSGNFVDQSSTPHSPS